jgi:hypothetical protein
MLLSIQTLKTTLLIKKMYKKLKESAIKAKNGIKKIKNIRG